MDLVKYLQTDVLPVNTPGMTTLPVAGRTIMQVQVAPGRSDGPRKHKK